MTVELELKLALAPHQANALRRHAALAAASPLRRRVRNTYFDTPDLALAHARMALRLRRSGGKWLQTLKAGGGAAAGLHQRDEWEHVLPRGELHLAMFAGSALDAFNAQHLAAALRPVFSTDFMRTTWTLEPTPGTRIEVALDQGHIRCDRRELAISEVELELKSGDAAALYTLASQLQDAATLRPDSVSKAERGYRLYAGRAPQPARFTPPVLDATLAPQLALRLVAGASLNQAERNAARVMAGAREAEFLHQARVALRRLRGALALAGHDEDAASALSERVRPVARALGKARDWDVLITQTLPPMLAAWRGRGGAALLAAAKRHRSAAHGAAREALAGAQWCATLLALSQWLGAPPAPAAKAPSLSRFGARQLARHHRRVLRESADLAAQSPRQRHRARIAAKRLRYDAEMFAPLFEKGRTKRYLRDIGDVQDALGACNDARTARRRIADLTPAPGLAAFATEWLDVAEARGLAAARRALARLARRKHCWTTPPGAKK